MLRRATRGAFLSARQLRRAARKQPGGSSPGGRGGGAGRRDIGAELLKDEGAFTGQQRRAFGKGYAETVPRALAVGTVGLLDAGAALGPRITLLDGLIEDDDDGR